ncbi:MAG: hypothetical protein WCD18_24955 [Thermosynechococcaceae cyanobacterium]
MQINRPHVKMPTEAEAEELEQYRRQVESMVADGSITVSEIERLNPAEHPGEHESADQIYRKLEIYRELVTRQAESGTLQYE